MVVVVQTVQTIQPLLLEAELLTKVMPVELPMHNPRFAEAEAGVALEQ